MTITPETRKRLEELIEERCLDLGMTLRQVTDAGGISYEAVRLWRTTGSPHRLNMRKLDAGLRWEPGSTERVLYGKGDPVPLPVPGYAVPEAVRRLVRADEPGTGTAP